MVKITIFLGTIVFLFPLPNNNNIYLPTACIVYSCIIFIFELELLCASNVNAIINTCCIDLSLVFLRNENGQRLICKDIVSRRYVVYGCKGDSILNFLEFINHAFRKYNIVEIPQKFYIILLD